MTTPLSGTSAVRGSWDGGPQAPGAWNGWLSEHSQAFDEGVKTLKEKLADAMELVKQNPSNAQYLGDYQEALAQYNLYRMLQSNSVKALSDTLKNTARNVG